MHRICVVPDDKRLNGWVIELSPSYDLPHIYLRRYSWRFENYQIIKEYSLMSDPHLLGKKCLLDLKTQARQIVGPSKRIYFSESLYQYYS